LPGEKGVEVIPKERSRWLILKSKISVLGGAKKRWRVFGGKGKSGNSRGKISKGNAPV